MRQIVVMMSAGAAAAFIVASGLMNWVFMTSLGKSGFEQQIYGAVSVAISAFIALLPTLVLWAYHERRFMQIAVAVPVFAAFIAFSLSSAVGFSAKNRGAEAEDRSAATRHLEDVRQDIADAEARRKALGTPRPVGVVREALHGMEQDRSWNGSKQCDNAATAGQRTFCQKYFDTKAESARAVELSSLESKIERLKTEARGYEAKGGGREADTQTAVLASLLGVPVGTVERDMTLFLALLVEVGAATGLYLALGHIQHEKSWPRPVERKIEPVEIEAFRIEEAPAPKIEVLQEPKIEPVPEAETKIEPEPVPEAAMAAVPEVEVEIVPDVQPVAKEPEPEIVIEPEPKPEAEQKTGSEPLRIATKPVELKLIGMTRRMRRVPRVKGRPSGEKRAAKRRHARRKRGASSNSLTMLSQ